jgi:hypothetical protein
LLTWDEKDWLYLLNRRGKLQGQVRTAGRLVAACCADDGSAYAAVGGRGEIWWLAPDLMTTWESVVPKPAVAVAMDPFGQYLAVADAGGHLHLFDRKARPIFQVESPRPFHHLAFVPAAPFLLGSSDYGLVACLDLAGNWVWRDGLVAHIGALTVSGDGERIFLACFTEGLQHYTLTGKKQDRQATSEPCRLAALSFDGQLTLVAGLSGRLQLLDAEGRLVAAHALDKPPVAIALGALGDSATVALDDGRLIGLELAQVPMPE